MKSAAIEIPPKEKAGHGGKREGAGRKPKALKYASELAAAESKIMSALPEVIDGLVYAARAGDVAAGKYLLDRAFGRPVDAVVAIANDTKEPFNEEDFEREQRHQTKMNELFDLAL